MLSKKDQLMATVEITKVSDLYALCNNDDESLKRRTKNLKGLNVPGLKAMIDKAKSAQEGCRADNVNYLDASNSYEARYGSEMDEWDKPAWKCKAQETFSLQKICINELVKHMVKTTKLCFENTDHHFDSYYRFLIK
jgi:hypothetical protein